jgi:hypothetical protein
MYNSYSPRTERTLYKADGAEYGVSAARAVGRLDGARHRLWLVTGADKAAALRKLWAGDASAPAGRVVRDSAFVFTDSAAAVELPAEIRSPH